MSPKVRKITAIVSTAALLGGGGYGVAQAADSTASTTGTTSTAPGHHGPRGGGRLSSAQVAAIATKLGVTTAQLQAALDANKPTRPANDGGATMATELATALGVDAAQVKTILDANRPAKGARPSGPPPAGTARPAPGTRPDQTKLIAALASGLNLDTATVKAALAKVDAAHKAAHDAAEAARLDAIAKQLGLSAADVKAAFDAVRPAPPAGAATTRR